jgi:hypothetical protein
MKKYNYFYNKTSITKNRFLESVPENWEDNIENNEYSYGYYKAVELI